MYFEQCLLYYSIPHTLPTSGRQQWYTNHCSLLCNTVEPLLPIHERLIRRFIYQSQI